MTTESTMTSEKWLLHSVSAAGEHMISSVKWWHWIFLWGMVRKDCNARWWTFPHRTIRHCAERKIQTAVQNGRISPSPLWLSLRKKETSWVLPSAWRHNGVLPAFGTCNSIIQICIIANSTLTKRHWCDHSNRYTKRWITALTVVDAPAEYSDGFWGKRVRMLSLWSGTLPH